MAKITKFDSKSVQNRECVKRHRQRKKLKLLYENEVQKIINANKKYTEKSSTDYIFEEPNISREEIFTLKLKKWAVKHRITAMAINDLLQILIFAGFNFLPKDSRTIMETPKNLNIKTLTHGRMWYHGLKTCLENVHIYPNVSILTLNWNFDGLPEFKSSDLQFWPILASIKGNLYHLSELANK